MGRFDFILFSGELTFMELRIPGNRHCIIAIENSVENFQSPEGVHPYKNDSLETKRIGERTGQARKFKKKKL